ncbi:T7SS effector LXG polymorphic toxin [Bacillus atrophaeus]|uniref:T7SS effector LXG polymorphic toxin n=1 Tax=Bacillus atrophaeus TaxID=1452 RepID=UPI002281AD7C|nr:T7SS effector LXG polymorphic toxin [Bacillus atrophaeus]MCY9195186.1 T7SS effector LXG polymorphic toxin [Bacillus atrophaeus]MEC1901615.1 T7SS effector LXG polymorphic toxin [Bacillus atrophaeus]MEC2398397.1 T7SS effector LXG polymorphic toxin [Bacillus atrophaeus]MED4436675.1 T7SS effector LXG polymorphic toxin [Bacillus atrophaeus]MED4564471.1 T7SS effector LXG polymorphic toxin [Bacillus atrophaeus]
MSKVFESQSLIDEAEKRKKQYETFEEQLNTLKKAFQGVADLGDDFKGKGADNIKDFFQGQAEIVDSWLTLVSSQIAFLKGISGDIKDQELSDSYVETSFLDHELPNGDLKASEIVSAHKAEIDSILSGISDIIDLDMYSLDHYADKMDNAQKIRRDTITAVDQLDESLTTEYQNLESLDNAVLSKYSVLMQATSNGKSATPMYYDKKAFHSNEVYKSVIEVEKQGTSYIEAKEQQAEARRLQEKAEEEANKPWYEKTWDGICTFTGEVSGYYDYKRATEGVDPVTGEKLSAAERVTAGAMAAAGFIPVVGWAGRAFKGGKAIYKTGKAAIAAEHALDAYKTGKSLDILKMSEMGAYGLIASNGFSEAVTGRDMFGNKVSEEKRKQGALEAALSLVGISSARYVDKLQRVNAPYNNVSMPITKNKDIPQRNSRIEYLRNKYGKLSKEEIHQRINLRGEVHQELNRLISKGIGKKQRGPAIAGVLDKKTGKYFFGINEAKGYSPEIQHEIIRNRIENMPIDLKTGYEKTLGAGSHAEVYALNDALLSRPDAKLDEFMVYVISARKINKFMPQGSPMPRCPHCEYITDEAHYIPEVLNYGRK